MKLPDIVPKGHRENILFFRWLIVLTSILLMVYGPDGLKLASGGYLLALFFFASNIALTLAPKKIFDRISFVGSVLGLDILLLSVVIHLSGGAVTDLYVLYLFVVFTALPASSTPVSAVIALFASVYYAVITYRAFGASQLLNTTFMLKVPFFFLIASFSSLVSRQAAQVKRMNDEVKRLSTEMKWRLQKARKSEERLYDDLAALYSYNETILNSIETGIMAVDLNGTITAFNRAAEKITGLKCDHVLFEKTAVSKSLEEMGSMMLESLKKPARRREIEVETAYGESKTLGISTYLMKQKKQKVVGVVAVFADLTEIRNLQKKLKNSENMALLGEMAACVAHELRTPLSSIQGVSELIVSRAEENSELRKNALMISKEVSRIENTIREILSFSGSEDLDKTAIDTNVLLEEIVASMKPSFEEAQTTIELHFADDLPRVYGDVHQLRKVYANLILNSLQAVDPGGKVEVSTARNESGIVVTVKDNGPGIPRKLQKRIFNPFFTTKDKGTGLGLAIVRKAIEDHDGIVELRSAEEEGSEFIVHLPIGRGDEAQNSQPASPSEENLDKTILVADDDAYIRDIFTEVLTADGYNILLAEDGEETIRKAVSHPIDLLVLDIKMPIINGIQVIEHMTKINPQLPIIVITGYTDMKDDYAVRNANVVAYLSKPVRVAEFRVKVDEALKGACCREVVESKM